MVDRLRLNSNPQDRNQGIDADDQASNESWNIEQGGKQFGATRFLENRRTKARIFENIAQHANDLFKDMRIRQFLDNFKPIQQSRFRLWLDSLWTRDHDDDTKELERNFTPLKKTFFKQAAEVVDNVRNRFREWASRFNVDARYQHARAQCAAFRQEFDDKSTDGYLKAQFGLGKLTHDVSRHISLRAQQAWVGATAFITATQDTLVAFEKSGEKALSDMASEFGIAHDESEVAGTEATSDHDGARNAQMVYPTRDCVVA